MSKNSFLRIARELRAKREREQREEEARMAQPAIVNEDNPSQEQEQTTEIEEDAQPQVSLRSEIKFDEDQLAAVDLGCREQYCNIVGSAGTGKTTTVMRLIDELSTRGVAQTFEELGRIPPNHTKHNLKSLCIGICAFTGKARDTIMRAVPNNYKPYCYTLHKLLDYGPDEQTLPAKKEDVEKGRAAFVGEMITKRVMIPRRNEDNPLPFKIVVIDEISMVGASLLSKLFDAILPDTRIITIGDMAQLTPVLDTPSHPLLIAKWPTQELRKIYRQEDGDLIDNANRIRVGDKPKINDNFRALVIPKDGVKASRWVTKFIEKEYEEGRYDPAQDLLITPHNVGPCGQEILNLLCRSFLNPDNEVQSIHTMRGIERFAVGDRVVNRKNDYEIGVTNGMVGTITDITLNAGMGKFSDQGLQTEEQKANVASSMADAVAGLEREEKVKKLQSKLTSFSFGKPDLPVDDEEEDGTSERRASHTVRTQFDYLKEDSPDGHEYLIDMHQSSQLNSIHLGWWITVYIAQGSSARNVYVLMHPEHGKGLNREMLYTAVTRARKNVTILTTPAAVNKALRNQLIKGDTLKEKVDYYARKQALKERKTGKSEEIEIPMV